MTGEAACPAYDFECAYTGLYLAIPWDIDYPWEAALIWLAVMPIAIFAHWLILRFLVRYKLDLFDLIIRNES